MLRQCIGIYASTQLHEQRESGSQELHMLLVKRCCELQQLQQLGYLYALSHAHHPDAALYGASSRSSPGQQRVMYLRFVSWQARVG